MKASEKGWGVKKISSVAEAIKELRHGLRLSLADVAGELGVNPASVNRYETGKVPPPIDILFGVLAYSLGRETPRVIVRAFVRQLAADTGLSDMAVIMAALITLEGPEAPRHIARLAKQALEILEE